MNAAGDHARSIDVSGVVGPSRWWGVVEALDDVPPGWNDGRWARLIDATSDDGERATATHVDAARQLIAAWDGELETLSVSSGPAQGEDGGYRVEANFRRGAAPLVRVSGSDVAQVDAFAQAMQGRLSRLVADAAAEDAQAVPPGRAANAWRRADRLGVGIAIGISLIVVLAVAGSVWAWWSSR